MKEFMNKPITWGGYFKLCGVCTLLSMGFSALYYWMITKMITKTSRWY